MSRSRNRDNSNELRELKRENLEMKAIIKSLQRQLKQLNRQNQDKKEEKKVQKEAEAIKKGTKCNECKKGPVVRADLGIRTLLICKECGYRQVLKNG